jgi:hypothetical protein
MADNKAEIVLDGDISPLRQKLREAGQAFKTAGQDAETAFGNATGPLKLLQEKFVAIAALLAVGAVFKEAIRQTEAFSEESIKLGRALGIAADEASVLREALAVNNTSQDEFVAAGKGLTKQLRENESGLNAMGLKTRDAAGQLRPLNELVLDAITVVNGYKAGTDRAVAGQVAFGKGFEMTSNLATMTTAKLGETKSIMQGLGMVASTESVAAWETYDDAANKSNLTLRGLYVTIGKAVIPALASLAEWFISIGPAAATVLRGVIGGLISVFWGLRTSAVMAFEAIGAAAFTVAEPIRAIGAAFIKLMQGDFQGATDEILNIPERLTAAWSGGWDNVVTEATKARDAMWNLFAEGTPLAKPDVSGKSAGDLLKDKGDTKTAADPSLMGKYEAELALKKNAYEQENVLRQFSKEQELAFWQDKLASIDKTSKDGIAIEKRAANLSVEIRRQSLKEQRDLDSVMIDHRRNAALAQVEAEAQAAGFARDNGEINQRQMIALDMEYARRRFEIEYQAQLDRIELSKNDPNVSPAARAQLNEQLLAMESQYQLRRNQLQQDKGKADNSMGAVWEDAGTAFGAMAGNLLTKATTLQQQLASVFGSIYQSFVTNLVSKPLGDWIAGQAKLLAVKMGFIAQEKAVDAGASAAKIATKAAETTTVVAANAAEAGAGAAASQASIPFVGPVLALAAMATVFAAVMAMGSKKSAARGYDIPKGLNPMTQLHEEEMVLPQQYANVIRGLAGNTPAAESSSSGPVHFHVNTMDVRGVKDFLKQNADVMAPGLRQLARNFTKP